MTQIDREKIATLSPHAGTMCLLDEVVRWDMRSIRCRTGSHQRTDNPLRRPNGVIGSICGVEIAAQAMAVHSRLRGYGTAEAKPGYLTSVRDVRLHAARLDHLAEELLVDAELLAGDARSATYRFAVGGVTGELISGRATVLFDVAAA